MPMPDILPGLKPISKMEFKMAARKSTATPVVPVPDYDNGKSFTFIQSLSRAVPTKWLGKVDIKGRLSTTHTVCAPSQDFPEIHARMDYSVIFEAYVTIPPMFGEEATTALVGTSSIDLCQRYVHITDTDLFKDEKDGKVASSIRARVNNSAKAVAFIKDLQNAPAIVSTRDYLNSVVGNPEDQIAMHREKNSRRYNYVKGWYRNRMHDQVVVTEATDIPTFKEDLASLLGPEGYAAGQYENIIDTETAGFGVETLYHLGLIVANQDIIDNIPALDTESEPEAEEPHMSETNLPSNADVPEPSNMGTEKTGGLTPDAQDSNETADTSHPSPINLQDLAPIKPQGMNSSPLPDDNVKHYPDTAQPMIPVAGIPKGA